MAKKNKVVAPGQCYESCDRVFIVIDRTKEEKGMWYIQDTLSKNMYMAPEETLLSWRRPFENFG